MSAPRLFLKTAVVLVALALVACDDPARVAAPEPESAPAGATSGEQHGDAGLAVSTWPRSLIAEFETELEATPVSRGRIVNVEWRFADGTVARGQKVRHTFAREGVTSVFVRGTTESGDVMQKQLVMRVTASIASLATTLVGIVPGGVHNCAIDAAAALSCWGFNGDGNLGNNSTANSFAPVTPLAGVQFAQIATGFSHSCALSTGGVAYCWGRNYDGQLGDGTTTFRSVPTPVATSMTFASIDVGFSHSCAVTELGAAYCWGSNALGQIGDDSGVAERHTPTAVSGGPSSFSFVRAGYNHTCGLAATGGAAYCWGSNNRGQIGNGSGGVAETDVAAVPTAVAGGHVFSDLDIGGTHNCGIVVDRVYCWGWNSVGQIGALGATSCVGQPCFKIPIRIQGGGRYVAVTAGNSHSCAITSTGQGYCWGNNSSGQLGDGTTVNRDDDTRQAGSVQFKTIRAGGSFTCGVSISNVGYCWGNNSSGKLGLGDTTNRLTPVAIPGMSF